MTVSRRVAFVNIFLGGLVATLARARDAQAQTYGYDAQGRVTGVAYPNGDTIVYAYDAAGNRTTMTGAGGLPSVTLTADPLAITPGGSSNLTWTSVNATSVSINQGAGSVTPVAGGAVSVSPGATTTYTATATGPGGAATAQATVTVNNVLPATIQITGSGPVNLRTLADAAGYNGQGATITFEVGNGVTITGAAGAPNGGVAIDSGVWPTNSWDIALTLVVKNGGVVRGGGGRGGVGGWGADGSAGGVGGDAISLRVAFSGGVIFESGSEVKGGGGGGGGGGGRTQLLGQNFQGGAAGGGQPNGPGGASFGAGGAGTTSAAGAGAAGQTGCGAGAAGAVYAATGSTGAAATGAGTKYNGGAGGAGGYCVRKNGNAVSVTNNGTTAGTIG